MLSTENAYMPKLYFKKCNTEKLNKLKPNYTNKKGKSVSIAYPGQFKDYVDATWDEETITFPVDDIDSPFYVAAHALVAWCELYVAD